MIILRKLSLRLKTLQKEILTLTRRNTGCDDIQEDDGIIKHLF